MIGLVESYGDMCMLADIMAVVHVPRVPGRAEQYVLQRHSGKPAMELFADEFRQLEARPVQIMPAEPGTHLIKIFGGATSDEKPIADRSPIIGWALCVDGQVRPITPAGVCRGYNPDQVYDWYPCYIEMPARVSAEMGENDKAPTSGSLYEFGCEAEPDRHDDIDSVLATEYRRQLRYEADRRERTEASKVEAQS